MQRHRRYYGNTASWQFIVLCVQSNVADVPFCNASRVLFFCTVTRVIQGVSVYFYSFFPYGTFLDQNHAMSDEARKGKKRNPAGSGSSNADIKKTRRLLSQA